MPRRLADRLSEVAKHAFVGRWEELDLIVGAASAPESPFAVAYVQGPGGIGKSAFLRAMLDALPRHTLRLPIDCREVEPTANGLMTALAAQIGAEGLSDVASIASGIAEHGGRAVIALDAYENLGLLDAWLRQVLLPALPEGVLTVIASREAPSPGWTTNPGWQAVFREIHLSELSDDFARRMLEARGVTVEQAGRAMRFAHGHPLALELAAAALRSQPDLDFGDSGAPDVVSRLTRTVLQGLDERAVCTLEATSTVRRITESLLAALLEVPSAREEFDALRRTSFASAKSDGVFLHDVIRDAISLDLSQRDPERHADYRERAWRYLTARSHHAAKASLWNYTADLLYLVQNANVRNAFFRAGAMEVAIESPMPGDGQEIEAIARSMEPPASAEWLLRWWDQHPETFKVARTATDRVAGFYIIFEPQAVDEALLHADPLTAAWCRHLEMSPVAPHERVLLCRRWLSRADGEAMSAVQAACWLDIKRLYMELRPNLRRLYCPVIDIAAYAPVVTPLGFIPIEQAHADVGGTTYYTAMLDFGEGSVDGWLGRLVGAELRAISDGPGAQVPGKAPREATVPDAKAADAGRIIAILFTDIVGHTEMMRRLGDDRGREVLREHERLTRETLKVHDGAEVKTMGDGFMASFGSVTAAMDCAIALQRAFAARNETDVEPLHVRVGLNAGEPIKEDGDLFGSTVILAARVAAQASADEILVPEPVRHLLTGKDYVYADRGEVVLKGFEDAMRLYEARWRES